MIHESWFDSLTKVGLRQQHWWLTNLPSQVERIANFGCWSGGEPFALLWTLDAKEVMVVEMMEEYMGALREQIEIVTIRNPEACKVAVSIMFAAI